MNNTKKRTTTSMDSKDGNRQPLNMGKRALFDTLEYDKVTDNLNGLFDDKNLEDILSEPPKRGRKTSGEGKRYKPGRIKQILDKSEGERVVPIYDGFDPVNGGITFLTPYEHRFVILVGQGESATRAAEIASLNTKMRNSNSKNFRKVGNDLMSRPQVRVAIGQMQKKICVAAALDAAEVISNIREIAALSLVDGKYEAALKANIQLGEFLGMFGKTKDERAMKTVGQGVVEVFKSGEDLVDNKADIKKLSDQLGLGSK